MINPLKVATAGYLKRTTKAVLIIAVAGYLNFGGIQPPTPTPGAGGITGGTYHDHEHEDKDKKRRKKVEEQNRFIIEFLKMATDIINNQ